MMEILDIIVLVALAAAFVVLLVKKWGIAEYMQVHGDRFTSKLFSCDLCMSFWACAIVSVAAVYFVDEWWVLTVPVFSTPLTRMMV